MKNLKHLQNFKGNPKKMQGGWVQIAALALSALAAEQSYEQGQVAASTAAARADEERKAQQAQERAANVRAQQERVKQQREARIARSRILAATATEGIGASSASGAIGSIRSQEAANISSINVQQDFANQASTALQNSAAMGGQIAQTQAVAQQWQTLGSFGQSIFKMNSGSTVNQAQATTPASSYSPQEFWNLYGNKQ